MASLNYFSSVPEITTLKYVMGRAEDSVVAPSRSNGVSAVAAGRTSMTRPGRVVIIDRIATDRTAASLQVSLERDPTTFKCQRQL
jgi:hypothetical protein